MSRGPLEIEVVCSNKRISELEPDWSRLHRLDPRASGWTEPHLLIAFQQMYFPTRRLRVIVAREPNGTVCAILPITLEMRRVGPLYLRRIVSLASGQTCYPDAVIEPGKEQIAMEAITVALREMVWDELCLRWVMPTSHLLNRNHGLAHGIPEMQSESGDPLWKLPLHNNRELLRSSARKEMSRRLRRLSECGMITIGWEPADGLRIAAQEYVSLHSKLKDYQRQRAFFRMGRAHDSFPQWVCQESDAGRVALFAIRCDGTLLAGAIILRHRQLACCYRVAWDPGFAAFGLGILLVTKAIEACRERGDREFDIGPGVEAYKSEWASESGPTLTLAATRSTWRSKLARQWLTLRGRDVR